MTDQGYNCNEVGNKSSNQRERSHSCTSTWVCCHPTPTVQWESRYCPWNL